MPSDGSRGIDANLPDEDVRGIVDELVDGWAVETIERMRQGTDFVASLDVRTPAGDREAVLKATTADLVPPVVARSEPRLLALVGEETSIPVPDVYGYCDDHSGYPSPFYLLEYVPGENYEGESDGPAPAVREQVVHEAGRNLAELHDLGPLPANGRIGVRDGELAVLDSKDHPQYDDYRECLLENAGDALDAFDEGGYFPGLADDPERFADLASDLRSYLRETVPALPEPDPPTYAHTDYRYGNLLVDHESGRTNAVLDWANASAADPAYNLASTESLLFTPDEDPEERTAELRRTFREAYADARDGWRFDDAVRERMDVYHLVCRLHAMACLPLWYQDETPEGRDRRAAEHRAFVNGYL